MRSSRDRKRRRQRANRRRGMVIIMLVLLMLLLARCAGNLIGSFGGNKYASEIDISKEVEKGEYPMFFQYDSRWDDLEYGDGEMEETGCGPTCLSIVHCGLTGKDEWNPYAVAYRADSDGYYVYGTGSSWDMMTSLAEDMGLDAETLGCDENAIRACLENDSPIICAMGPGDFTTAGHFIVLTGIDENGEIILRDPNSEWNSKRTWDLDRLMPQMKNLWAYDNGWFN